MSDIREHVAEPSAAERLLAMARHSAGVHAGTHDYLPATKEAAQDFEPHTWVIHAMALAYVAGSAAGKEELREELRNALGVR